MERAHLIWERIACLHEYACLQLPLSLCRQARGWCDWIWQRQTEWTAAVLWRALLQKCRCKVTGSSLGLRRRQAEWVAILWKALLQKCGCIVIGSSLGLQQVLLHHRLLHVLLHHRLLHCMQVGRFQCHGWVWPRRTEWVTMLWIGLLQTCGCHGLGSSLGLHGRLLGCPLH